MFLITCSFATMTVTSIVHIPFSMPIKLLFSCDPWSTATTFEYLAEIEVFTTPYSLRRDFEFVTNLVVEFLCDDWFVSACIPITTSLRIFKFSVVKRACKNAKHHPEWYSFALLCPKSLFMGEFPYLPPTVPIIGDPFKHLLDERCSC